MSDRLIAKQDDFEELCGEIRKEGIVAFDTEFVSESTYRPELCLLQFATPNRIAAVDPYEVQDLSPWWDLCIDADTVVVAHAAREEIRFCLTATGQLPQKLVDVQIAEGLQSTSYPLSYERLVYRVLNKSVHGRETRTDWRNRPLTERQIEYALDDVRFLLNIWDRQKQSLTALNRLEWADAEFERLLQETSAERSGDTWRRLSGIHKLRPRELAIARELYLWRDAEAERRNIPVRRVLRDDLLLDMARRRPTSESDVLATRDMRRPNFKKMAGPIAKCVQAGLAVDEDELPRRISSDNRDSNRDEHVIGQLLGLALANRCAELQISKSLVGTSSDLRYLVRWHLGKEANSTENTPRLSKGWRADVCGELLTDMLDGRISLRVADPESDHPLVFERD